MTDQGTENERVVEVSCVSRFLAERYATGELEGGEARRVEQHLEGCARCRRRVADLVQERQAFLTRVPFETFYRDLEQRVARATLEPDVPARTRPKGFGTFVAWGQGLWGRCLDVVRVLTGPQWAVAAVATLAMIVVVSSIDDLGGPSRDTLRIKATGIAPAPLEVVLLRDGVITQARSGDVFHAGDRLQFRVTPGTWRYLHLVSLDDQGRLTPFYPDDGGPSLELGPDAGQLLPDAIELDDFLGQERIFAIFSHRPLDYSAVVAAASRLTDTRALPLDLTSLGELPIDGTAQVSFLMIKE